MQPKPGTRILIHGAAGSVGSLATQIAKRWGAEVIGTASGEDIVYLRSLGHVQVVDFKQERFETVGQVDAVLDLIGGETATRSFALVKKGGVLVSTVGAANAELAAQAGIRGVNLVSKGNAADLSELADVADTVDGKTAEKLIAKLIPGGVYASVVEAPRDAGNYSAVKMVTVVATPDRKTLEFMVKAVLDGEPVIPISR